MTSHTPPIRDRRVRQRSMQKVTWISTWVDLLLSAIKLLAGVLLRSPALIADGLHSLSDLITDAFVLAINRIAHAAPDAEHPYGHARFETIGTTLLGLVLLLVAAGLAWDNTMRLLTDAAPAHPSLWAIAVAAVSLLSKEALFRYGQYWAKRLDSELLQANAWHSRSDALSSLVVLLGVAATWFGYPWVESWAALLVAALIGKMGAELAWNALQQLADRGLPEETQDALRDCIREVPGVINVHDLRSRWMGNQMLIDLHVQVDPGISVSEGHQISDAAMRHLYQKFPRLGDITLHIDPENDHHRRPMPMAPLRPEVCQALSAYPALASGQHLQIHYRRQRVTLDIIYPHTPPQDCHQQRRQALAELLWLEDIRLYQVVAEAGSTT